MITKSKKAGNPKKGKKATYAWISLIIALFFWVPLLNVVLILPASIIFGIKAMIRARKHPELYNGFVLALISTIFASISFVASLIILIMSINGILSP
jgi:uncharacterized membrane protein